MNNSSTPHDAQRMLESLREHLARHDKPIAFLFGAGTSCSVRVAGPNDENETSSLVPATEALTDMCKKEAEKLGKIYSEAWLLIQGHLKNEGRTANVEDMLSHLRMMRKAVGSGDTLFGLSKDQIKQLEKVVRERIAKAVSPDLREMPSDYPH